MRMRPSASLCGLIFYHSDEPSFLSLAVTVQFPNGAQSEIFFLLLFYRFGFPEMCNDLEILFLGGFIFSFDFGGWFTPNFVYQLLN